MKKIIPILFLSIFISSCSSKKKTNQNNIYFEEDKNRLSYTLDIKIDSSNQLVTIERQYTGTISNRKSLQNQLEKGTNKKLDSDKPLVVIYYPGKDECNTSENPNLEHYKSWYKELEDGLWKTAKVKPIYIYKNSEGLEKFNGIIDWNKDPNAIIEKTFFKYHYPCSSFVVISKTGKYISYFGEFPQHYVWKATDKLKE